MGATARQAGRNAAHTSSPPSGCSSAALRARWAASRNGWLRQASVQSRKTTSWPPDATLSRWRSPCDRTTGNPHAYSSRTAAASSASPSRRAARSPGSRSPTSTPSRSTRASPASVAFSPRSGQPAARRVSRCPSEASWTSASASPAAPGRPGARGPRCGVPGRRSMSIHARASSTARTCGDLRGAILATVAVSTGSWRNHSQVALTYTGPAAVGTSRPAERLQSLTVRNGPVRGRSRSANRASTHASISSHHAGRYQSGRRGGSGSPPRHRATAVQDDAHHLRVLVQVVQPVQRQDRDALLDGATNGHEEQPAPGGPARPCAGAIGTAVGWPRSRSSWSSQSVSGTRGRRGGPGTRVQLQPVPEEHRDDGPAVGRRVGPGGARRGLAGHSGILDLPGAGVERGFPAAPPRGDEDST